MASYWSFRDSPRGVARAANDNFAPVTRSRMRASKVEGAHNITPPAGGTIGRSLRGICEEQYSTVDRTKGFSRRKNQECSNERTRSAPCCETTFREARCAGIRFRT